jgi:hypothetical protein
MKVLQLRRVVSESLLAHFSVCCIAHTICNTACSFVYNPLNRILHVYCNCDCCLQVRFQDYIDTTQRAVSPLLASGGGGVRAAAASAVAVLPLCGKDPDGWAHAASRVCVEAHAMVEQVCAHSYMYTTKCGASKEVLWFIIYCLWLYTVCIRWYTDGEKCR